MHREVVAADLTAEHPRLLAATIVYGLTRAEQDGQAREHPEDASSDCLGREVAARQDQARVWALAWPEGGMPRRTAAESRLTDLAELELADPRTAVERWVREQDGWWLACGGTHAQLADAFGLGRRVAGADLGEQTQRLDQARVDGGREQEDGHEGGGHAGG